MSHLILVLVLSIYNAIGAYKSNTGRLC
jgi:hypothetical protein